jgi:hypothetical protein
MSRPWWIVAAVLAVGAFLYALMDPDANPIGSLPPPAAGAIWAVVAVGWVWLIEGLVAPIRRRYSLRSSDLDRQA